MKISRRILFSLLLIVGAALTALPVLAAVLDGSPPGLQRAMEVQDRHTDALMARPGVVGTAVGLRGDGEPVVLVLTEHGLVGGLPRSLEGVPVLVKVTGKIYARNRPPHDHGGDDGDPPPPPPPEPSNCSAPSGRIPNTEFSPPRRYNSPVPIGVSTGHPDITAGTIGARVIDSAGIVYALSNNHVYANENNATIGVDDALQPGVYDGGVDSSDDAIGTLCDFEPIVFSGGARNTMDAAIAISTTSLLGNATPAGYGTPKSVPIAASLNMGVKKYGRTTAQTSGKITAINVAVRVRYTSGMAKFVNQIIIEPGAFSAPGDSGSLIVADDNSPVGLLFAGSSSITIANPIGPVLLRFGVTIDGAQ